MNKRFLQLATILLSLTMFSVLHSCNEPVPEEPKDLVLSVDKTSLRADNKDCVIFKVMYGEENVTAESVIKSIEGGVSVTDSVFMTDKVGAYSFEALYNDNKSNQVRVTSTPFSDCFEIILTDLMATGVNMRVEPKNYEGGYYFDVVTGVNYDYYTANGWQELIDYTVYNISLGYSISAEEALEGIISFGPDEWTFQGLQHNTDYYAVAMGLDSLGKICTDLMAEGFHTPDVEMVETTFEITFSDVTYNGADYTIVPSDKEVEYFSLVVSKAVAEEFESDEELARYCLGVLPDPSEGIYKGDKSFKNDGYCQPGRDFYVIAFGYDSGVVTSRIAKGEFSTKTEGDPAACTFSFQVANIKHTSADVAVTPSNKYNVFFTELIEAADVEALKEVAGSEDIQDIMNVYWKQGIMTMIQEEMGISAARFADMFCIWGDLTGGTYASAYSYLKQETQYYAYAVCVDEYGVPVGDFYLSEPFTTTKEVVVDYKAPFEVLGWFDSNEVNEMYEESYFKNMAVVVVKVTPNPGVTNWYADIFAQDLSDRSRETLLKNLTVYAGKKNTYMVIMEAVWDEPCTVMSVAQDANGHFGEILLEVLTCTKDKKLPASEFAQYKQK